MYQPQHRIVGLDLSLRGSGMVFLPPGWSTLRSCEWSALSSSTFGIKLPKDASVRQRVERLAELQDAVCSFVSGHGATHVFLEDYSFGLVFRSHAIGELGGAIKLGLYQRLRIVPSVVNHSAARKILLGKVPRKGAKDAVEAALKRAGAFKECFKTPDEGDAFAIANYGLTELGYTALTLKGHDEP